MNENLRSDGFVGLGNEDGSKERKNNRRVFEIKFVCLGSWKKN